MHVFCKDQHAPMLCLSCSSSLTQPLLPECGNHHAATWQLLRTQHLIPPEGLPMLTPTGRERDAKAPSVSLSSSPTAMGSDWTVVVVCRPGKTDAVADGMMLVSQILKELYGEEKSPCTEEEPPSWKVSLGPRYRAVNHHPCRRFLMRTFQDSEPWAVIRL